MTIYLALSLSKRDNNQEFHVLLILIMLLIAIFFCHSMIRLCMMLVHPPEDTPPEQRILSMVGPGGYANPAVPIRVALARDEEAAGIESQATKLPPPAYGLWRESVVCTPLFIPWNLRLLILHRGWTRIASSGSATRLQHLSLQFPARTTVLKLLIDPRPISLRTVSAM